MLRKTLISVFSTVIFLQATQVTFAQDVSGQKIDHIMTNLVNQASKSAQKQGDELQSIIARADTMISVRLTSLNTIATRIQNDTQLTSDEKSSLSTDVQNAITGLNTLKTKIDADTDAATAKVDTKQIVTNYYVFEVFEPKMRLLIMLNNMQMMVSKLQSLTPQLTTLVSSLNSEGKDTSAITPLIVDINTQLQTMSSTISSDITKVQGISTTSNDRTLITQVKADIATIIKTDFEKIRSDMSQLRAAFKGLKSENGFPTNISPTVTSSVSATPELTATPSAFSAHDNAIN